MNRSITVQPKTGFLPWRAHPGPETTVAELEAAISLLKLNILRTTDDEILLVQTDEAIKAGTPPPDTQELLVEETGQFTKPTVEQLEDLDNNFDDEAKDRHAEGV